MWTASWNPDHICVFLVYTAVVLYVLGQCFVGVLQLEQRMLAGQIHHYNQSIFFTPLLFPNQHPDQHYY